MSPSSILGRNNISIEPSPPGDQHIKISDQSKFVCPPKCPIEIPSVPSNSSILSSSDHLAAYSIPLESSRPELSFGTFPVLTGSPQLPESALKYPQTLFSNSLIVLSPISAVSVSVGSFSSQICDLLQETIPMVQTSSQSPFNYAGNFRSNFTAPGVVSSSNSGAVPAFFFNSSVQHGRPVQGRVLPSSILGFRPLIGNAQISGSTRSSAEFSVQSAQFSAESSHSGPGSLLPSSSPSRCWSPTGNPRVNSGESTV